MKKKKIILYALFLTMAVLMLWAGVTLVMLDAARRQVQLFQLQSSITHSDESILEEAAWVEAADLKYFTQFTNRKPQLDHNQKGRVVIPQNTVLTPIINNDCQRVSCLQHRISFDDLPAALWKGLLGVEDYRFLEHEGVDIISILRAIVADIKAMSLVQGGSTLTQQLVKNLFLHTEKTIDRKYRELVYSLYLETVMEKEEILNAYFNEVFWGTFQGVYLKGVFSAALAYFQKAPAALSSYEAAILIALLKGPQYYHPSIHPERLQERVGAVYKRLLELGLVEANSAWSEQQWQAWLADYQKRAKLSYFHSMHLVTADFQLAMNPYEKFVFYESANKLLKQYRTQYPEYDFAMKALICANGCEKKFEYYSKFERKREEAIFQEKHQVGSILKPIVYYLFTKLGKNWEDKVAATPLTLQLKSGTWSPKEASRQVQEEYTIKEALQLSRNIPLIRLAQEVGFAALEEKLMVFLPQMETPLAEYPAQLLGAVEMSLDEVQKTYHQFFKAVCTDIANQAYTMEQSVLSHMSEADKTTLRGVSKDWYKQLRLFGKTGTSNEGLDNWFIASDTNKFYAIWFGVESKRSDKKVVSGGATTAFTVFQDFIEKRGRRVEDSVCL